MLFLYRFFFRIVFCIDVWSIWGRFWNHIGSLWELQIGHLWYRFWDDFCMSFQERPKSAQEGTKSAQERPKSAPRAPKRGPRGAKRSPRAAKSAPKEVQRRPMSGKESKHLIFAVFRTYFQTTKFKRIK